MLIAASICRSRDRRRQIPIMAIQSLICCVMLMIFVPRWALNTRPFKRDFNDRQDVRRAARNPTRFLLLTHHPAQIQRRGLKV
jgi:hypothetical protein